MGRLLYSAIASLDGYIADEAGDFAFAFPDEEVHAYANDVMRPVTTHLYGRRLYEVMSAWQTMGTEPDEDPLLRDFGEQWRAGDKIVYSTTLGAVTTPRTRLERRFDPDVVRRTVEESEGDVLVGGAGLAAHALAAGLVDDVSLVVVPVVIGGGTRWLPDGVRLGLSLTEVRRFSSGFAALRYDVRG